MHHQHLAVAHRQAHARAWLAGGCAAVLAVPARPGLLRRCLGPPGPAPPAASHRSSPTTTCGGAPATGTCSGPKLPDERSPAAAAGHARPERMRHQQPVPGSTTDVPPRSTARTTPAFIEADVRQAAAAGLSRFTVNWSGTGSASQTTYNSFLQPPTAGDGRRGAQGQRRGNPVQAVAELQGLRQDAVRRPTILGDLGYFVATYGGTRRSIARCRRSRR